MKIDEYISITKALSDKHRVRVVLALKEGELCVCQIVELTKLAPSTTSKHMSILKQAGIVKSRKEGKWVYYFLNGNNKVKDFIRITIDNLISDKTIKKDFARLHKIKNMDLSTLCKL